MQYSIALLLLLTTLFTRPATAAETVKGIPRLVANVGEPADPTTDIGEDCSLRCAIGWDVSTSSHLKNQGKNNYSSKNIDDGLAATAWIVQGYGIGQYVTFSFPDSKWPPEIPNQINFNGFRIINGYMKSEKAWRDNSRVKTILISINDKPVYDVRINDTMTVQEVSFDSIYLRPGSTVKVEIRQVYKGARFSDKAISELVPQGAH